MKDLSNMGRIFYGISIAVIGGQAIYYRDFPYIVPYPGHFWAPAHQALAVIFGTIFILAGASIILKRITRQVSLLFGGILLAMFCFYYIPYQFLTDPNYMQLADWENAEKELALAGGAFVIAGCFKGRNAGLIFGSLGKLVRPGAILFAITIVSFGTLHFLEAKDASTLVPSWIPYHMFWIYFCGAALIGSGISIIFKIRAGLIAALLGTMILIWFILLHIPRVITASAADIGGEVTSAFLALAYSGIAFAIAGAANKKAANLSEK